MTQKLLGRAMEKAKELQEFHTIMTKEQKLAMEMAMIAQLNRAIFEMNK